MLPLTARFLLEAVGATGTLCSLSFYFLCALSLADYLNDRRKKWNQLVQPDTKLPGISILKPLKGIDPEMWQSLCSHCEQDYPEFQMIFGVSDPADPAIELVHRLKRQYPNVRIDLISCAQLLGPNIKVSNLVHMLPAARHDILVVNDSDIRVPPDYLSKLIPTLTDSAIGMVTCLYRGVAAPTLGSRLEAVSISADFIPGVLSARFLERGLHFGLGSTLLFRRSDLDAIGGFEVLLDYLADDYELGRRIAAAGKRVELSPVTVSTFLPAYTLREYFRHQLRWSRTIRDSRRWGYAGLLFTFGLPWALLTLLMARGAAWSWILLAVTVAARLATGMAVALLALNDRQIFRNSVLLPVRDLVAPFIWAASFMGSRIYWRGDVFNLKNGRLTNVGPVTPADSKK